MVWWEAIILFFGGWVAGIVNAMAGGGSSLTVPLLVLAGVPGNFANGSNRLGIFVSNGTYSSLTLRHCCPSTQVVLGVHGVLGVTGPLKC